MRVLLIGLLAVLLALPAAAQQRQKRKPQPAPGDPQRSQFHKQTTPRPALRPGAPATRPAPEPFYDTEKAMR